MNVLSLFDGISCGQVALERAGIKVDTYYASEINEYAIQIAKKNYPDIVHIGDVNKINFEYYKGKIDLLIGGSPCQGFSFMGNQLNFEDERSKLFFKFVEALNIIKPKYFLLENVKMKTEYEKVISEKLEVLPILIDSAYISAQMRKRLYWTNIPNIQQIEDKNIKLQDILESGYADRDKSLCILESENRLHISSCDLYKRYKAKSLGQIVYFSKDMNPDKGVRMLTQIELEKLQTLPVGYTQPLKRNDAAGLIGNGWTVDVIVHILKNINKIL